jgi:hypothetical protein
MQSAAVNTPVGGQQLKFILMFKKYTNVTQGHGLE